MAPPLSPRRSSRARLVHVQSHQSSVSSTSSGRQDRLVRSSHRPASGKSTRSASLSSEALDDRDDPALRRRTRGQEAELGQGLPLPSMANGAEQPAQDDEDEAVRCICGSDEYPGRPTVDGPDAVFFATIELTEDVTGFFVQCDICKVWQHGACVGIITAESSPDEYFCEQCRKDLHKIHIANNGQRYSKYLPLYRASRATSRATSIIKEGIRSPKTTAPKASRPPSASHSAKRRSTMNSRDAAYDDELLQRVIEASKEDVVHEVADDPSRRCKRARSESEENQIMVKRQRTRSISPPPLQHGTADHADGSDVDSSLRGGTRKTNGKSHLDKSEKEERELLRQEAAQKRKGRAERRRAEDSDLSEEMPLAATKAPNAKGAEASSAGDVFTKTHRPGTPSTHPATISSSHKRSARSHHKRARGRNQYTKDRDLDVERSPAQSTSRDPTRPADDPTGPARGFAADSRGSKGGGKPAAATRLSMHEMRRRVAAIMEFISRTQVDLAAENGSSASDPEACEELPPPQPSPSGGGSGGGDSNEPNSNKNKSTKASSTESPSETSCERAFKELTCIEMMDVLTRDMVKWQNQYS